MPGKAYRTHILHDILPPVLSLFFYRAAWPIRIVICRLSHFFWCICTFFV